jgi:glycerol-3-phosphate acyltransferase PlsY
MAMLLRTGGMLLGAYLLGSIPFAYIVTRLAAGKDIRTLGDGNMGAKNTYLSVGPAAGVIVGVADITKGMLAVEWARMCTGSEEAAMVAGMAAVMGHDFPPFLKFRGGQGMATMIGAFLLLFPLPAAAAVGLSLFFLLLTRNWDAAWTAGFLALIAMILVYGFGWDRVLFAVLLIPTIGLSKLLQIVKARRSRR